MSFSVSYSILHYNVKKKLISKSTAQAHSFVKAFLQLLYCLTSNLSQSIVDIDNVSRTIAFAIPAHEASLWCLHPGLDAGENSEEYGWNIGIYDLFSDDCGIQVGTSSTAVAVADDNLVTPIAHGSSSGQFVYYGCYGLNYTTGASSASFDIEREFRNDSGGSIAVQEIGIYSRARHDSGSGENIAVGFCIMRDVISPSVTVLNGEYLKVKYTIQVSV